MEHGLGMCVQSIDCGHTIRQQLLGRHYSLERTIFTSEICLAGPYSLVDFVWGDSIYGGTLFTATMALKMILNRSGCFQFPEAVVTSTAKESLRSTERGSIQVLAVL